MIPKTILFIHSSLSYPERGGIERVTDILASKLKSKGYRLLYLYLSDYGEDSLKYDYPAELFKLPSSKYDVPANISFVNNLINENRVDIILNQAAHNPQLSKLLSQIDKGHSKLISAIHFNPKMSYGYLFSVAINQQDRTFVGRIKKAIKILAFPFYKLSRWINITKGYRNLAQCSDKVCLLSSKFIPELKEVMPMVRDEQICYIFNPNTYSSMVIEPTKKLRQVLCVARFDKAQKRQDRLLHIWEMVMSDFPDWELVFVGDGATRKELERMAEPLERVRFEGWRDPQPYYQESSIFCMTSTFEGFGMTLIEAMIHRVPVIAFESFASITDIVKDDYNGYLITPFDINSYGDKLRELMSNKDKCTEMAINAQNSVAKFDLDNIIQQWEDLFDEATK